MSFFYSCFINIRKLKHKTSNAFFLIIPIAILMALTVIITSHTNNFQTAASETILGTAEEKNTILRIEKQVDRNDFRAMIESQDQNYSDYDTSILNNIEHVESSELATTLPVQNVTLDDLFSDTSISIYNIIGLEPEMATLYTAEDFTYKEGKPIPVILNASTFTKTYEDWSDQDEITIEIVRGADPGANEDARAEIENQSPIKTEAIDYTEANLIGKTITLTIGGMTAIPTYSQNFDRSGIVFKKYTQAEIDEKLIAQKEAVGSYWDYDKLYTDKTYTLVVVGVIESANDFSTYLPTQAGNVIMKDYFQREIDARVADVPIEQLNAVYNGITYDGTQLSQDFQGQIMRNSRFGARGSEGMRLGGETPNVEFDNTESYTIPGLVIETDSDTDEVTGQLSNASVYEEGAKSSQTIWVKIDDVANRDDVVAAINKAGYSFQDLNDLEIFGTIDKTLGTITLVLSIAFIALSIGVIILTMSKFVSESRREIGIFRAMGMTKGGVRFLFTSQAVIYTLVGYGVGLGLGVLLTYASSGMIFNWYDGFMASTMGEGFEVIQTVESSVFNAVNWKMIEIYTTILAVITVLIALIPATQASKVSPVEAIRGE